jgi:hypothetical protein
VFKRNFPQNQGFRVGIFFDFRQELGKAKNQKSQKLMGEEGIEPTTN